MSDSSALRTVSLFTAEFYNELNRIILSNGVIQSLILKVTFDSNSPAGNSILGILLILIVGKAKNLLEPMGLSDVLITVDYITASEIVEQYPQLRDIFLTACQGGNFGDIINLQLLHTSITTTTLAEPAATQVVNSALYNSFNRPYVGEAVSNFVEYLTSNNHKFSNNSNREYYAKFCSIIQNSGTGKTRLLTEVRKEGVLILYINIRELSDSDAIFPERDKFPSFILTGGLAEWSQTTYTARCRAFFAAIFITLRRVLHIMSLSTDSVPVVTNWNNRMCDMRSTYRSFFFAEVEKEYWEIYRKIDVTHPAYHQGPASGIDKQQSSDGARPSKRFKADVPVKDPLLEGLVDAYGEMLDILQRIFDNSNDLDRPRLVIGIDEAHTLNKNSRGFRPLDILYRTTNAYSRSVADFSAPREIHDSLRVEAAGQKFFKPFTRLGWDYNADALSDISANDVAVFDHIAGFGRPLWKSFATSGKDINSIMALAKQKLCNSQKPDMGDEGQALVVLSQRFALDVCFSHPDAISYVEKGVESHLRICYSTAEDRRWSFTGYPSEPLLSCAAASILHDKPYNIGQALEALKRKVDGGMFEVGQSGAELTSRLLLLLAKDIFVRKRGNPGALYTEVADYVSRPNDGCKVEPIDCQKVSVVKFLEYLFGNSFWLMAGETAKKSFAHAYINFSHWMPMGGLISPEGVKDSERCTAGEWTLRHWHRTAAVQCSHLQPLVDKMIPIYFDDPELGLDDINRVSQMFVSDKAGKKFSKKDTSFITRAHRSIECVSPPPFIALLLDLNGEPALEATFAEKDHAFWGRSVSAHVEEVLRGLISKPKESPSDLRLDGLVKAGDTITLSHMEWEKNRGTRNHRSSCACNPLIPRQ